MTTDRGRFPSGGREDNRPLGSLPRMVLEESDDGRHWRARGAAAGRSEARIVRLKIDAGSPLTEDMWP